MPHLPLLLCVCVWARTPKITVSLSADFPLSSASRLEAGGEKGLTPSYLPAVPLSALQTMALHPDNDSWNQCPALSLDQLHGAP